MNGCSPNGRYRGLPLWYMSPVYTAADLRMVDKHIAQGERHVVQQEELISRLLSRGLPTDQAEDLLAAFESNRRRIEHAARNLLNEIGAKPVLMHSGYFRFCD